MVERSSGLARLSSSASPLLHSPSCVIISLSLCLSQTSGGICTCPPLTRNTVKRVMSMMSHCVSLRSTNYYHSNQCPPLPLLYPYHRDRRWPPKQAMSSHPPKKRTVALVRAEKEQSKQDLKVGLQLLRNVAPAFDHLKAAKKTSHDEVSALLIQLNRA